MNEEKKENNSEMVEELKNETPPVPELTAATEVELKLEELQKQVDQYKDLLLRKAAEFENYKRRVDTDSVNIVKYATESFIEDLLPAVDDFERSLKHGRESSDYDALIKGIELIYQKITKVLENRGVKSFETVGKEFSVDFHDALMQMPRADLPPQTVIQEVEKGYMLNDKVLRHAKVIVSSAPEGDQQINSSGENS